MFNRLARIQASTTVGLVFLLALSVPLGASHGWASYHWARTANPFTLKVGDNVASNWDGVLNTSIEDWNQSTVLELTRVPGSTTGRKCRPTAGRVEVCNAAFGFNGWLGVASIWASGNHITQGTVKLNDSYFNTPTYNTTEWRNLVSCQEIGHTLGLDHQDENFNNANLGTCMDYTNSPSTNQHPNLHDYDQLVTIYSHLDNTTTVAQTTATAQHPPAMNNIELDGPGQWGRVIRSSANGRVEVYELDFGNGQKIITHVTWVEGRERGRPE